MAATTVQLIALGNDRAFQQRVSALALQEAAVVYVETGNANHATRVAFAIKLLQTPGLAAQLAPVIAQRTNLVASTVTYDFTSAQVQTDATDAAVLSQIASDWNMLSGV